MLILMRSDQKLGNMLLAEDHQQVVNKGTNKEKKIKNAILLTLQKK